jgi:ribosomal protein S27E
MEKMNLEELEQVSGGKTGKKSSRKIKCPKCRKSVTIPSPAPAYVKCSCGTKISIVKNPF